MVSEHYWKCRTFATFATFYFFSEIQDFRASRFFEIEENKDKEIELFLKKRRTIQTANVALLRRPIK
jgi:hypothetical protein